MSTSGQCIGCKHYTMMATCEAFPDKIPYEIISGQFVHDKPYPGDHSIQYEPIIPGDEDDDEYEEKSAMEPSALDRLPYLDFSHLRKSLDYGDIHVPRLVGDDMEDDEKEMKEEDEELEKEGSDSDAILALLQDEKGGVESLTQVLESVQDPKLKEILEAVLEDEQKHQAALEQWIQENGGGSEEGEGKEGEGEPGEDESPGEEPGDEGPSEMGEIPEDDGDEDEEDLDKDEAGSKEDLIDEIRAILEQHEAPGETEKAEEVEGKPKEDDKDDEDLPNFLKEDDEDGDEDEETEKCTLKSFKVPIIKGDRQIVYGVVSEPDTIDLQGDRLSKAEICKACHKFMMECQRIGKEHEGPAKVLHCPD